MNLVRVYAINVIFIGQTRQMGDIATNNGIHPALRIGRKNVCEIDRVVEQWIVIGKQLAQQSCLCSMAIEMMQTAFAIFEMGEESGIKGIIRLRREHAILNCPSHQKFRLGIQFCEFSVLVSTP